MSLYAIPDIHGRLDLLEKLWFRLDFNPADDKIIFLGDMIDRGPDSKGVLEFIKDLEGEFPGSVVVLAGNHEWLAVDACVSPDGFYLSCWIQNGGDRTLKSYRRLWVWTTGARQYEWLLPREIIDWLRDLPLSHEEPGFFFSHAPLPREEDRPFLNREQGTFTKAELTWTYNLPEGQYARDFRKDDHRAVKGVCGHVHALRSTLYEPRFYDHYIFADAGCGCHPDAPLVAVDVEAESYIAVGKDTP